MNKVAAIQMCSSDNLEENLTMAANLIKRAVNQGAKLVVLPENFAFVGLNDTDKLTIKETFGDGPIQNFLSEMASTNNIWLVGGTIPLATSTPSLVRAASLVFNSEGKCIARYDKIHLFDVKISQDLIYSESTCIESGDKVVVVETPFGNLGLAVCYDIRFPELFLKMSQKKVDIISLPSAFTQKTGEAHWEILVRARAIENQCYVIAPNQSGKHTNGKSTFGHTMIVNPWGTILGEITHDIGAIVAEVCLEKLNKIRENMPIENHRKL